MDFRVIGPRPQRGPNVYLPLLTVFSGTYFSSINPILRAQPLFIKALFSGLVTKLTLAKVCPRSNLWVGRGSNGLRVRQEADGTIKSLACKPAPSSALHSAGCRLQVKT